MGVGVGPTLGDVVAIDVGLALGVLDTEADGLLTTAAAVSAAVDDAGRGEF